MMKLSQSLLMGGVALLANSLTAQDAPPQGEGQGSGPGLMFSQAVGAQYDSKAGFVPTYRVELAAPVVRSESLMVEAKLANDFAVLTDKLDLSLATRFRLAPWLSASLETPFSLTYRAPTDFSGQVAAAAKLAVSSRTESQDRPGPGAAGSVQSGWVLGAELSATATAAWSTIPQAAMPAYLAAAQFELGYQGVVSPNLKVVATADLGALTLIDVKSIASLAFNWEHLVASASVTASELTTTPALDYSVGIGYRF